MPSSVSKGYLALPWGQVHYRTAGAGCNLPVLLLLHQTPLSSRNYEKVLPLLADACRPFALDTPGYGGSCPPPEEWEVGDYADAVWACADQLGADRVFLFGRATGAVFAIEAALRQTERVRSLMLHGMPVYTAPERTDRLAGFAPPIESRSDGSHLQKLWARITGEYPWIDPELATYFVRDFLSAGSDFAQSYRAIWRYDLPARVGDGPTVPTLLVGGEKDRIAFMHQRAVAQLPRAEALILDAETDFVAEQNPERFANCLKDFMRAHH